MHSDAAAETDEQLLRRYATHRDEPAFTEVVRRRLGLVLGTARRKLGEGGDAEDVAQTVFAILARKAQSASRVQHLGGWLHRVTVAQTARAVRRIVRERRKLENAMLNSCDPEARDPMTEVLPLLDEVIEALPESDRRLVLMRYAEGLPFSEVAARTGRTETALRQQTGRAIDKLAVALRRRGAVVPAAVLTAGMGDALAPASASACAASVVRIGHAALLQAPALTGGAMLSISFLTMNTIKTVLTGAAVAAALAAVPLTWRAIQVSGAEKSAAAAHALLAKAPGADADAGRDRRRPRQKAAAPGDSAGIKPPASLPADIPSRMKMAQEMMEAEMRSAMKQYFETRAYLEAGRTALALSWPPEREESFRAELERIAAKLVATKFGNDEEKPDEYSRKDAERESAAWLEKNLPPAEFARWQELDRARKEDTLEQMAEGTLHKISSMVDLTPDQKEKLFRAASEESKKTVESDWKSSVTLGLALAPRPQPALTDYDSLVDGVLDDAQMKLFLGARETRQSMERDFPRHMADRGLQVIGDLDLGDAVVASFSGALNDQVKPPVAAPDAHDDAAHNPPSESK